MVNWLLSGLNGTLSSTVEATQVLTIRHFIGAYGSIQLILAFAAAFGVTTAFAIHDYFCHQIPHRSFHLGENQFSLCARCMGVYAGLLLCAVIQSRLAPSVRRNMVLVMALSFAILGIEKILLELNGIEVGNVIRFFVGIGLGYCLAVVVFFLWDPKTANPFKLQPKKSK